jgi:tetratricopeptide (TPR) repeat protein
MRPVRHQLVEDLFHLALEQGEHALDTACGDDPSLRADVEELLVSYRAWSAGVPPVPAPDLALPRFGPYQCDSVLGSGGMGTVYRAHRDDGQYTQPVAIKVLRGSLRSDWYRQRFRTERQILARLNHPHIARLLDGGMTAEGEPYLVMELVEGEPIDDLSDRRRLTVAQRLALFDQVLDAVDYAHRSLIVHRDLKPSNILVTDAGEVKLLDFGTSKLVEEEATNTSLHALTPRYASPEQLRGETASVASDVFSAGVVLYELLTGAHPFGAADSVVESLRRATGDAVPAPPASSIDAASATARASTPASLRKLLAGDLDSILRKSLVSDIPARYATAAALRDDLTRYANGLPVQAKPATLTYRARKFVRRNRVAVVAGIAMIGVVAIGIASTWWEARIAQRRFEDVRQLAHFVIGDMNSGLQQLPGSTQLQKTSVERSLQYLDRLLAEAGNDPALRLEAADGYLRLGDVLGNPQRANLGERGKAQAAYQQGLAALAPVTPSVATRRLAAELHLQHGGTRSFGGASQEGMREIRDALAELQALQRDAPEDDGLRLTVARGQDFLGTRVAAGGGSIETARAPEAKALYESALREAEAVLRHDPSRADALRQMAVSENNLALLSGSEHPVAAVDHHRRALTFLDRLPAASAAALDVRRLRANILLNTGWAEGQSGAYDDAAGHVRQAGKILETWSAVDPSNTNARYQLTTYHRTLGIIEGYRHDDAAAAQEFLAAADLHRQLSETDPSNKIYRYLRGELLVRAGNGLLSAGRTSEARQATATGLQLLDDLASAPDAPLTQEFGACRWFTEAAIVDLRKPQRAAEFCRRAMQMTDGKDPDAYAGLANAESQMGHKAAAVQAMQTALSLLPPTVAGQPVSQQRRDMETALHKFQQ